MTISKQEVIDLMSRFHDVVMFEKGDAKSQGEFFLYPEPMIFIPHGEDISLQTNYEIHQKLTDEMHISLNEWEIIPLTEKPERVRAIGAVYWQGRLIDSSVGALIKCVVGEDWIVQRTAEGVLKIVLYINSYHHFLPDSAPIELK
ncbi:hypothetical protein ACQUW5_14970 [Legionella sp. CNM-1927-20]|uniref:hypothetical protein n=1 Tax=Legionella sp. CNM-1927-20 TaxID=3422221 RepID=UPI00403A9B40